MSVEIKLAYDDIESVKQLFCEYAGELNIDLEFQNFKYEIESLPGKYALPFGRIYIATHNSNTAGCVALCRLDKTSCEMKRLYVRPQYRGKGIGESLAKQVIKDAKSLGYGIMYLDTLTSLKYAVKLYKKLGFNETKPYYNNPLETVVYMRLNLT